MSPLHRIAEAWSHRSTRERRLAVAVLSLAAVFGAVLAVKGGGEVLDRLDREIAQLENEILNSARQAALRDQLEARLTQVANQHSSAWSESEIRDRLRQEIYRLSNLYPPALDPKGIPLSTASEDGVLVNIPELGKGQLIADGEGYREYQIEFSILPVEISALAAYLERLMESPQSLRIDRIEMWRDPSRSEFAAKLLITRTVMDDVLAHGAGDSENDNNATPISLRPDAWQCDGCEIRAEGEDGAEQVIALRATADSARAWMEHRLPTSGTCKVDLEIASNAEGKIGVDVGDVPLKTLGDTNIKAGGQYYRYTLQCNIADETIPVGVAIPVLRWGRVDSVLRVRHLQMYPDREVHHAP